MRTRQIWPALFLVMAANGAIVFGQPATAPQSGPELPPMDPVVQKWVQGILDTSDPQAWGAVVAEVMQATRDGKLSTDAWLTQCMLFLSKMPAEQALGEGQKLTLSSKWPLRIAPSAAVKILAPYVESADRHVAESAGILIFGFFANAGPQYSSVFQTYLRSMRMGNTSWQIIRMVYEENAEMASQATLVYFGRPDQQRILIERRELQMLTLSYEFADEEMKPEWSKKIQSSLDKMAGDEHWSIRAYALISIYKGYGAPAPKGAHWSKETDVPARLINDENPFVSGYAKMAAQHIKR